MKLEEFLQDYFKKIGSINGNYIIEGAEINLIKDALLTCDEFKGVKQLVVFEKPSEEIDGRAFNPAATKFNGENFRGEIGLYSIFLSPMIADPMDLIPSAQDWQASPFIPTYKGMYQVLSKRFLKEELELTRELTKEEIEYSINMEVAKYKEALTALIEGVEMKGLVRKKGSRHIIVRFSQLDIEEGRPRDLRIIID